jgi:hypothetical protein
MCLNSVSANIDFHSEWGARARPTHQLRQDRRNTWRLRDFAHLYVFILQHASLRANDLAERLLDRAVGVVLYKLRELPQRSRNELMERPAPAVKRPQLK